MENIIEEESNFLKLEKIIQLLEKTNPEKFFILKDFLKNNKENRRNSFSYSFKPQINQSKSVISDFFEFLEQYNITILVIETILVEEAKVATQSSIFREESIGISLLWELWIRKDGISFIKEVLEPTVQKVLSFNYTLEVDPNRITKGMDIKNNLKKLLEIETFFLEKLYSTNNLFSESFIHILKVLDIEISKKFQNIGLAVVGGLLFFRLICPMVISPSKYIHNLQELPSYSLRTFVLLAKLIQKMATGSMDEMKYANLYVKKHKPKWKSYFHKLITGTNLISGESHTFEVTAEDLIAKSNQDISNEDLGKDSHVLNKQREIIKQLLLLEKQSDDWEPIYKKEITVWYKVFEGSSSSVVQAIGEVNVSVEKVYEFIKNNIATKEIDPMIVFSKDIKKYNENLIITHRGLKLPILTDRDFVFLQYSEILLEHHFAIICLVTVERDDVPEIKGYVRADFFGGYIIRGVEENQSKITFTFHVDGKGKLSHTPEFILRKSAIKQAKNVLRIMNHFKTKE